jgi:Tol biopolymer transport system component
MFPHEMEVVTRTIPEIFDALHPSAPHPTWGPDASTAKPLFSLPNYDAECSYSKNGRFVLYAHVRDEPTRGKDDADIWVYDTQTGQQHELVHADGYDGGPFWSPDNRRICYRSDRNGDDLLQLFVADLKFEGHTPVGISREYQVTNNGHVNWAPFWHPSGAFLVYGTSEVGHDNYEIFAAEAPPVGFDGFEHTEVAPGRTVDEPMTLGTRRITYASGADVLPVFSDDGKYMMWTAQRGPMVDGESKPSSQVWVAQFTIPPLSFKHEVFFLPRFDPPKSEDDARKIGLKVMEMRSSKRPFVGAERYENGWVVRFEDDCVDCRTNIYIHPNGTILRIGW